MQSSVAEFDPYAAWLGVGVADRPPNAYQLLGLKSLETDLVRIHAAIARQTLLLERSKAGADEQLWEQISEELEAASRTLLDSELKAVLDGALRRSSRSDADQEDSSNRATVGQSTIHCAKCGQANLDNRRFCKSCGSSLWEKCPDCQAECSCEERFCGRCGFDIRSGVEQRNREFESLLKEAKTHAANSQFELALTRLRKLAAIDDKRFEKWAQLALSEMANVEQQMLLCRANADKSFAMAKEFISKHEYDRTVEALSGIPETLRSDETAELLRKAQDTKAEVAALNASIRQSIAQKAIWNLLPKIQRLLVLKPDDAAIKKLALQLRDHFVKLAKAKIAIHEYSEAANALQQIVPFARNEEVEALEDKATELDSLWQSLQNSAVADRVTISIGQKLVKYVPSHEAARKALAQLEFRAKAPKVNARLAAPNCILPAKTRVGRPIDWLGHITSVDCADEESASLLRERPGQYFVAFGLALQGLDEAHMSLHLTPEEKGGVLGKLSFGLRKAKPVSAWGIDLGRHSLKAIKLTRDPKSGAIQIERVETIVHSISGGGTGEPESELVLEQTLKSFAQRTKTDDSRIVANIPGQRVLGRFFQLPPLPTAKIAGAIQFEAKHQFPIPLEELSWSYQLAEPDSPKTSDQGRTVILVAARQSHVKDRLAIFKNAGMAVDLIQSDCLALHNAMHREFFSGRLSPEGDGKSNAQRDAVGPNAEMLAFVDMGTEGTNVVISSAQATWFRTFGSAGAAFTNAMVRSLQLTYEQAEKAKCDPSRIRRFHQYHDALQPLFVQVASEIERSLANCQKVYPNSRISHIYGVGGAYQTYGLLRHLRFG